MLATLAFTMARKELGGLIDMGLQEALIGLTVAVIGLLTALVEKGRRENARDHNTVRDRLDDIKLDVREVRTVLTDHLEAHADKK
jgi:hypothetical protein